MSKVIRKRHIVQLGAEFGLIGGAERLQMLLAMGLDPSRYRRTLCITRWSTDEEEKENVKAWMSELKASGAGFLGLKRRSRFDPRPWWALLSFLRRERVDVIHSHLFGSNFWGTVIGRLARVPVIVAQEHGSSFERRSMRGFIDREIIARGADVVIAVSREDRQSMIDIVGMKPEKIRLVRNALPPRPPTKGRDVRRELGIDPEDPVIGTVCELRQEKAIEVLIDAAAVLIREFPRLRVLVVGDGPERARLEALITERGLTGTVEILGYRSDVPDLLAAIDVAVICSDREGSPLALLEYMEAAMPIVATRVGGIPHMVDHETQSLLIDPRDPEGLAQAIAELLGSPDHAKEMGRCAQERWQRDNDFDAMMESFEQLYEELLERKDRHRAGKREN